MCGQSQVISGIRSYNEDTIHNYKYKTSFIFLVRNVRSQHYHHHLLVFIITFSKHSKQNKFLGELPNDIFFHFLIASVTYLFHKPMGLGIVSK